MEALGTLLAVATVIVVVAYISQPFLAARREDAGKVTSRGAEQLKRRAELLAERNRIYRAIKDLDYEQATGKVNDADYAGQRHQLVAQGVEVLQQIDALPISDDDAIERAVLRIREGAPMSIADVDITDVVAEPGAPIAETAEPSVGFCPQCGTPAKAGDRFCAACGTKLRVLGDEF